MKRAIVYARALCFSLEQYFFHLFLFLAAGAIFHGVNQIDLNFVGREWIILMKMTDKKNQQQQKHFLSIQTLINQLTDITNNWIKRFELAITTTKVIII